MGPIEPVELTGPIGLTGPMGLLGLLGLSGPMGLSGQVRGGCAVAVVVLPAEL